MRERPVRFSLRTGLRLCGIADEPFWPSEKNSSASSTSVRCRCRISVARRSTDDAITPSVAKYIAWRSRGMTWVGIDLSESADRARDGASCDFLAGGDQPFAGAGKFRMGVGELQPEGHGFGMD